MSFLHKRNSWIVVLLLTITRLQSATAPLSSQIVDYSGDSSNAQGTWGRISSQMLPISGSTITLTATVLVDGCGTKKDDGSSTEIFHDLFIGFFRDGDPLTNPFVSANLGGWANTLSCINGTFFPDGAQNNNYRTSETSGLLLADNSVPKIGQAYPLTITLDSSRDIIKFGLANGISYDYSYYNVGSITQIAFGAGGNKIQYDVYSGVKVTTPPAAIIEVQQPAALQTLNTSVTTTGPVVKDQINNVPPTVIQNNIPSTTIATTTVAQTTAAPVTTSAPLQVANAPSVANLQNLINTNAPKSEIADMVTSLSGIASTLSPSDLMMLTTIVNTLISQQT